MRTYAPTEHAVFVFRALYEPPGQDRGWTSWRVIQSSVGQWNINAPDIEAGLNELMEHGWVEENADGSLWRLTPNGVMRRRFFGARD